MPVLEKYVATLSADALPFSTVAEPSALNVIFCEVPAQLIDSNVLPASNGISAATLVTRVASLVIKRRPPS